MRLKHFLLKSVPYVLSVSGGILLYVLSADNIHDVNLNGLISNIAASLLAIPLIFVLYEYVNYKLSSNLNEQLAESMVFDVNSLVLKMIKQLRKMMGAKDVLNWVTLEKMLHRKAKDIKITKKVTTAEIDALRQHKRSMNELAYKLVRADVLSERQIQLVILMTKECAHVVNEWEYNGNTQQLSKYIETMLNVIEDWFDSCEREALRSHQQFQLTIQQEAEKASENNSVKR